MALKIEGLTLLQYGQAIDLHLPKSQTLCVVGPSGSGKSGFLRLIAGAEKPDRGSVSAPTRIAQPQPPNPKLRAQDLSHRKGVNQAAAATDVLSHLGLWDVRQRLVSDLTPPQLAACELVPLFLNSANLAVIDGHLDRLDPWARLGALHLMKRRCAEGVVFVVSTNHLALAEQFDHLLVLREHQPVYCGLVADLAASRGQRTLTIESEHNRGVRALIEPLGVSVTRTESGYKLEPGPGQDHAAKLLREGYGDIKYAISDERPLAEIIESLI